MCFGSFRQPCDPSTGSCRISASAFLSQCYQPDHNPITPSLEAFVGRLQSGKVSTLQYETYESASSFWNKTRTPPVSPPPFTVSTIQDPAAEGTGCTSSLPTPACLWLSPREMQLAGGKVVRVLTKVDKTAYADVQYHWKLSETKPAFAFPVTTVVDCLISLCSSYPARVTRSCWTSKSQVFSVLNEFTPFPPFPTLRPNNFVRRQF